MVFQAAGSTSSIGAAVGEEDAGHGYFGVCNGGRPLATLCTLRNDPSGIAALNFLATLSMALVVPITARRKAGAERNGSDLMSAMIRDGKDKRRKLSKQAKADRAAQLLSTLEAESLKVPGDTLETALPAPAAQETIEQAAGLLASLAATTVAAVLEDREGFRQAYRIIESRLHPDNGADRDAWEAFQNAAVLLERHHVAQERRRRLAEPKL